MVYIFNVKFYYICKNDRKGNLSGARNVLTAWHVSVNVSQKLLIMGKIVLTKSVINVQCNKRGFALVFIIRFIC